MKVVVIGTRGIPNIQGGVETHCQELYPKLVALGCDVTIIRRSCYITPDNICSEYKGVKLKDIYAPRKKSLEAIVHSILAVIEAKKQKADILHIHAIGPALVTPFARLLGLNVVLTHHGPDYDRQKWGKLAKTLLKFGEYCGVKCASKIIVISDTIWDIVSKKYGRTDMRLIHNGVPKATKIQTSQYIESLGLKKGNYILAMGRIVPEKGFDLLIEAFKEIRKAHPIQLVIAGDADHETPYSKELKRLATLNDVVLTGFISGRTLQELLTHARLFVLPSYHEGLPIALLEAMSYNVDTLVSDIPANKEISLPESNYFSTGNFVDLANKAIDKLYDVASPDYSMDKYDWDAIAVKVLNTYNQL